MYEQHDHHATKYITMVCGKANQKRSALTLMVMFLAFRCIPIDYVNNAKKKGASTATKRSESGRIPREEMRIALGKNRNATRPSDNQTQVQYRGVSGLGHRLARMSNAYHVAKIMNQDHLWTSWGWECGKNELGHPDIFDHLFGYGPMLVEPLPGGNMSLYRTKYVDKAPKQFKQELNKSIRFVNDVYGYKFISACEGRGREYKDLVSEKCLSDLEFYQQLRTLFRFNDRVRIFSKEHDFTRRVVLGVHVRGGNGEKGDFEEKGRGFRNMTQFLKNFATTLHLLSEKILASYDVTMKQKKELPPLIFLATDDLTAHAMLQGHMAAYNKSVVVLEQKRIGEGEGVAYYNKWKQDECRENWVSQFIDACLLGISDAVVAAKYSSFTQTLPVMSLFSDSMKNHPDRPKNETDRFSRRLFCEAQGSGTSVHCYDDYLDWIFKAGNHLTLPEGTNELPVGLYRMEVQIPCGEYS